MEENRTIIAAITETHLSPNILDAEAQIEGYQLYRADRLGRHQGGVALYIANTIASGAEVLSSGSNGAIEWLMVRITRNHNLIFTVVYRPPGSLFEEFSPIINIIENKLQEFLSDRPIIIVSGDFNFPNIDWDAEVEGAEGYGNQETVLLSFRDVLFLNQIIKSPTRDRNILDLVFVNDDNIIMKTENLDTTLSDHRLILVDTMLDYPEVTPIHNTIKCPLGTLNFGSVKTEWDSIIAELADKNWEIILREKCVDDIYNTIMNILYRVCVKYTPIKKAPKRKNPIPRDRKIIMRKRSKLRKTLKNHPQGNQRVQDLLDLLEMRLIESHREEKLEEERTAIAAISENSSYFFKYAKSKSTIRTGIGPLRKGEELEGDPVKMSDMLRIQYETAFSCPLQDANVVADQTPIPEFGIGNISVEPLDFLEIGKSLHESSAQGPDGLPSILLKKTIAVMALPLSILWKESLRTGEIPEELKTGRIIPIFKGGDRSLPENYRPVSLTSPLIKICEKEVVLELGNYIEAHGLYNEEQHGFRQGRSCLSQLLAHQQDILEDLANGTDTDVVYLDFAKAFDKVDHGILLKKLQILGVRNPLLAWIRSFLTGRKQFVEVSGARSTITNVRSGVPQGSVLGPLLFLIHIADINKNIRFSTVRSFADDTRILKKIKSENDCHNLQKDLDTIYEWSQNNNMIFNGEKFELIRYSVSRVPVPFTYITISGLPIKEADNIKDLGVVMSNNARFDEQISSISTRARKQVGWILRVFSARDRQPMMTLFKSLILPLLEYCCQLWSPSPDSIGQIRALEQIQRNFTSRITGLQNANYWERLKLLKLYSLERRRERYAIIYTWKIIMGLVPNFKEGLAVQTFDGGRRGTQCHIPSRIRDAAQRIDTMRENSLPIRGPNLFNILPPEVNSYTGELEGFKNKLDKFLSTIPDQPSLPQYHQPSGRNGLITQVRYLRRMANII